MTNGSDPTFKTDVTVSTLPNKQTIVSLGLTKREYFAAMAMQGILAANFPQGPSQDDRNSAANYAVVIADALLEALNREGTSK